MITHRRLKIFGVLILVIGFGLALVSVFNASTVYNVNSSQTEAQIQAVVNGANPGDAVNFAAGIYNFSTALNLKCGVTYSGPLVTSVFQRISVGSGNDAYTGSEPTQPTAVINQTSTSSAAFNIAGCLTSSSFTNVYGFWSQGSGLVYLGFNTSNVDIERNWCTSVLTSGTGAGSPTAHETCVLDDGALPTPSNEVGVNLSPPPYTKSQHIYVRNNRFGDPTSCADIFSSGTDHDGGCAGVAIQAQNAIDIQIQNNFVYHMEEGIHFVQLQNAFNSLGLPSSYFSSARIEYNWVYAWNRIAIEVQPSNDPSGAGPFSISHNVISSNPSPLFSSMGISDACCVQGLNEQGSSLIPSQFTNDNYIEWSFTTATGRQGIEWWGLGSTTGYNLIEGTFGTQINVGYGDTLTTAQHWSTYGNYTCEIGAGTAYGNEEFASGGVTSQAETPTNLTFVSASPRGFTWNSTAMTVATTCAQQTTTAPTISQTATQMSIVDNGINVGGTVSPNQPISIFYTTDGSTPTINSALYTVPFTPAKGATVKAIGMWGVAPMPVSYPTGTSLGNLGWAPSSVVSAVYTGTGPSLSLTGVAATGSVSTLTVGHTLQLTATCTYSDGSTTNCTTTDAHGNSVSAWNSSSSSISITAGGLATAVSAGSANITATVAGQTSKPYAITVTAPTLTLSSVSLASNGGITTLAAGAQNQLTATCTYSDGSTTNCSTADVHGNDANFTSSAPAVATVSAWGVVSAVAAGSTVLQASVQFGAVQANWGGTQQNITGTTSPNFINEIYTVLGAQAGGYTVSSCSIYLPAQTLTLGAKYDCGLISAPTSATQNTSWLCYGTYTVPSASQPAAWVTVPLTGCGTLGANSAWWVAVNTNQAGTSNVGAYNCGGSCTGAAPVAPQSPPGVGTRNCGYSAATYGIYSGLPSAVNTAACAAVNSQVAQYVTLGQPPLLSNTIPMAVTAAPPTLISAALTATGSPTTLTIGSTLQFAAKCTYSTAQVTDCTVADIYGNKVTSWQSDTPARITVSTSGLATAVTAGTANITANIGSLLSSVYALTAQAAAVTLASLSLTTTGGVTGLFVGSTNQLKATCTYSDSSTTNCTTTDAHGNVASGYISSDPSKATVNGSSGLVTGVAPGSINLTASAGAITSPPRALSVLAVPTGIYSITISGPIKFSGTVSF